MLAEKDFKGCQRFGCEESPQVEEEEASKEDLWEIQHIRADGVSGLVEDASVKGIDLIVLIYIIVPFPGLPLPSTSCQLKSCEHRWHLYAIRGENEGVEMRKQRCGGTYFSLWSKSIRRVTDLPLKLQSISIHSSPSATILQLSGAGLLP